MGLALGIRRSSAGCFESKGGDALRAALAAEALAAEALAIEREGLLACQAMGEHGAALLAQDVRVLTHCNAGRWPPPATGPPSG